MSKEDLIDISKREDFKELTKKGGSIKSEAKHRASLLRGIKMMKPETLQKKSLQLVADANLSAIEIMRLIQEMLAKEGLTDNQRINLIGKLIDGHLAIHGSKSQNINYNIEAQKTIADRCLERLHEWKQIKEELGQEQAYEVMIQKSIERNKENE